MAAITNEGGTQTNRSVGEALERVRTVILRMREKYVLEDPWVGECLAVVAGQKKALADGHLLLISQIPQVQALVGLTLIDKIEDEIAPIHLRLIRARSRLEKSEIYGQLKSFIDAWLDIYAAMSHSLSELQRRPRPSCEKEQRGWSETRIILASWRTKGDLQLFFSKWSSTSYDHRARNLVWRLSMAIESEWMRSPLQMPRPQTWRTFGSESVPAGAGFLEDLSRQAPGWLALGVARSESRWLSLVQ